MPQLDPCPERGPHLCTGFPPVGLGLSFPEVAKATEEPVMAHNSPGKVWTYGNGAWHEGDAAILAPRHQAFWLSSTVFDGARAIAGQAPGHERS